MKFCMHNTTYYITTLICDKWTIPKIGRNLRLLLFYVLLASEHHTFTYSETFEMSILAYEPKKPRLKSFTFDSQRKNFTFIALFPSMVIQLWTPNQVHKWFFVERTRIFMHTHTVKLFPFYQMWMMLRTVFIQFNVQWIVVACSSRSNPSGILSISDSFCGV